MLLLRLSFWYDVVSVDLKAENEYGFIEAGMLAASQNMYLVKLRNLHVDILIGVNSHSSMLPLFLQWLA